MSCSSSMWRCKAVLDQLLAWDARASQANPGSTALIKRDNAGRIWGHWQFINSTACLLAYFLWLGFTHNFSIIDNLYLHASPLQAIVCFRHLKRQSIMEVVSFLFYYIFCKKWLVLFVKSFVFLYYWTYARYLIRTGNKPVWTRCKTAFLL